LIPSWNWMAAMVSRGFRAIVSNEASCIKDHIDSDLLRDEMPSAPYQIVFLEPRKVEELAGDK
ncbi:hypothetical protein Tco_0047475, partial [Tanacetum coccineum]